MGYVLLFCLVLFAPGFIAGALAGRWGGLVVLWWPAYVLIERRGDGGREWTVAGVADEFVVPLIAIGLALGAAGVFLGLSFGARLRSRRGERVRP